MPDSRSAPMEPYLNRMSGSLVIQSGCGSSRKNLYQVKAPPTAPTTTRTTTATRIFLFHQPDARMASMVCLPSEGLQVLEDGVLLLGRQLGAVGFALVPDIGIAGHGGVEPEERSLSESGYARHEADIGRIVHVVPAIEELGPPCRRLEEIAHARHRAVVEIGPAEPETVQGHVGVAEGLAEMLEAPRVARIEGRLVHREVVGIGVEPAPIGADDVDRRHLAHVLTGKIAPVRPVAGGAGALVDGASPGRLGRIDGIGILRRLRGEEPILDAPDGGQIDGGRCGARAEGRALVALLHHRVVAVPVELLALARLLQPDR